MLRFHSHFVHNSNQRVYSSCEKLCKMFMFYLVCLFTWFFNTGSCNLDFFSLFLQGRELVVPCNLLLKRFSLNDNNNQAKYSLLTCSKQQQKKTISTVLSRQTNQKTEKYLIKLLPYKLVHANCIWNAWKWKQFDVLKPETVCTQRKRTKKNNPVYCPLHGWTYSIHT